MMVTSVATVPFTGALINHMGEPGLELSHLMIRVRDNVRRTTDGLSSSVGSIFAS